MRLLIFFDEVTYKWAVVSDGNRSKNLGRLIVEIHERLIDFEQLYIAKNLIPTVDLPDVSLHQNCTVLVLGNIRKKFKSQESWRMVPKHDEDMSATVRFRWIHYVCESNVVEGDNRQKSIVHFAGWLIGISAQSDWLLDPAIDRYNSNNTSGSPANPPGICFQDLESTFHVHETEAISQQGPIELLKQHRLYVPNTPNTIFINNCQIFQNHLELDGFENHWYTWSTNCTNSYFGSLRINKSYLNPLIILYSTKPGC